MIELTSYQSYLLVAYLIGILVQVLALFILSKVYCDELDFGVNFAILYVICATIQFLLFMKLITEKEKS